MARRSIALMDPRRLFRDDFMDSFFNEGMSSLSMTGYGLDMYETQDDLVVEVEAPKFAPEDVDISIEDQTLTISGKFKGEESEADEEGRTYHYREISQRSFTRSVTLPMKVMAEEAEAEFEGGIVKVTLPKAEETKPKKIRIRTA